MAIVCQYGIFSVLIIVFVFLTSPENAEKHVIKHIFQFYRIFIMQIQSKYVNLHHEIIQKYYVNITKQHLVLHSTESII